MSAKNVISVNMPKSRGSLRKLPKKGEAYHHGDLRQSLLKAALRHLETAGPETLSLRELAQELGVSQAAPYRHFKDRDALIAAISQAVAPTSATIGVSAKSSGTSRTNAAA